MKCFVCGKGKLATQRTRVEGEIKREKYAVEMDALVCDACGHVSLEGRDMSEFMRRLADAYRSAHHLLTSQEIREIRGTMSQRHFAEVLGVGVASIKRWELGRVQDKKSNKLMANFAKQATPRWTYEYKRSEAAEAKYAAVGAGLWPLAHGPPCEPGKLSSSQ